MKWEQQCQDDLEEVLDEYFPKEHAADDSGRSKALVLFAMAMGSIRKTIKAFGGCEKCFGLGYFVASEEGQPISFCTCMRGMQLANLLSSKYGTLS